MESNFLYTDEEKQIFGPYWDGEKTRYGDPIRIRRLLDLQLEGKVNDFLIRARHLDPVLRSEALGRLVDAARVAFELIPFDPVTGRGAREDHATAAIDQFVAFFVKKKLSTETQPTQPPSTGSGPNPPTPIISASGSTATEPDSPGPVPLPVDLRPTNGEPLKS